MPIISRNILFFVCFFLSSTCLARRASPAEGFDDEDMAHLEALTITDLRKMALELSQDHTAESLEGLTEMELRRLVTQFESAAHETPTNEQISRPNAFGQKIPIRLKFLYCMS